MRDVQVIPWQETEELVIAVDNSGAIGEKEKDEVSVSYALVSYYSFRVAVMECMAAGAKPMAVILQNFCGDSAWNQLNQGINTGIRELSLDHSIQISGSTESNFSLQQSVVGITVLGRRKSNYKQRQIPKKMYAVIGCPLVGEEVLLHKDRIAPLSLFYQLLQQNKYVLQPVGSKGIAYELEQLMEERVDKLSCALDIYKSSGPATCFIVQYEKEHEKELIHQAGMYFHKLFMEKKT